MHISDLPNAFIGRNGLVVDEKASVADLATAAESKLEIIMRNELTTKSD
jgi:hypothetical protein